MKLLFFCFVVAFGQGAYAQAFPDTILTTKGVLFSCRITQVDEHLVHYVPAVVSKQTRKGKVLKRDISSLALHSAIPVKGELPPRNPYIGRPFEWTEQNGIMYANLHDRGPQLGEGQVTINTLLQQHVRVAGIDRQIYENSPVTMLLKLWIDEHGALRNVRIQEHASVNGVQGMLTRYIEEEILHVVKQFQPWRPATTNGANAECMILLPLTFRVEMNSIFMLPSKYSYVFKGRRQ